MYTEDQGHLSYNKGPLAIYALQELIGEEAVNRGLSNFLAKFAFRSQPPYATSHDLVNELRAVAGPEYQDLITDLFEKIMLYELELTDASAVQVADGYEVTLTIKARQLEADGRGAESEVPLRTWFDVGLFADPQQGLATQEPLYLQKHLLTSGINTIVVRTAQKPTFASVDPYQKMADRCDRPAVVVRPTGGCPVRRRLRRPPNEGRRAGSWFLVCAAASAARH